MYRLPAFRPQAPKSSARRLRDACLFCQEEGLRFWSGISVSCKARTGIPYPDAQNCRKGMNALPFGRITLRSQKPMDSAYPKNLITLGNHIRKRRLDLKLTQKQVALILGTNVTSILGWETNLHSPVISFIPKIVKFLGYIPYSKDFSDFKEKLLYFRRLSGLNQEKLAEMLGIDETTVAKWERGNHMPSRKLLNKFNELVGSFKNLL